MDVVDGNINYIKTELSYDEVLHLLQQCDRNFSPCLSHNLDFVQYAQKLSACAHFILALEADKTVGFVAYYLNKKGEFIYIPLIWVSPLCQRRGIGKAFIEHLAMLSKEGFQSIRLEVLKTNISGISFYRNELFQVEEDRGEKYLFIKKLS